MSVINYTTEEPNWSVHGSDVTKIVLGPSPGSSGEESLRLEALPDNLAERFPALTHLYLWSIVGLRTLPKLPERLQCLDLRGCKELVKLPLLPGELETLDVGGCQGLTSLDPADLHKLKWLYLDGCLSLTNFGRFRPLLSHLERLELHKARFDDLPDFLCGEERENVLVKIREHYEAIESQGAAALPECKIVIIGNGGVGKTSLVRALKGLPHREQNDATEGIRLWTWDADGFVPFPIWSTEKVQLNVWDFGGQDLYHNTHRLFLESRAIFLLVWRQPRSDGSPFRKEEQYRNDPVRGLNYWLDQVFSANPAAQVLVARTGMDEDASHPPDNWKNEVREEYQKLPAWEVSAKDRNLGQMKGLKEALRAAVLRELRGPEAIRLGKGRRAVREELRQWQPPSPDDDTPPPASRRPILRLHEFIALVKDVYGRNGVAAAGSDEALLLLDYLHHCGALYSPPSWRNQSKLQGALPIIVDQRWAIEAIYDLFKPGAARDNLLQDLGIVSPETLADEAWAGVGKDGSPRYDGTAQWVFIRFMLSCGILVSRSSNTIPELSEMLLPELLPDYKKLARLQKEDPLIVAVETQRDVPRFLIRDRSLGHGFGCLLVGLLSRIFGKAPLYRYGGIGRIRVSPSEYADASRRDTVDVIVRVEWFREDQDAYQGDIVVRIYGEIGDHAVAQILHHLETQLRGMAGFPEGATFEMVQGGLPPELTRHLDFFRMPDRSAFVERQQAPTTRAVPRLGLVGISAAGADRDNPGIDIFPKALEKELKAVAEATFDVLYYQSDESRMLVSQLVSDLVRSDVMLAFIGQKYLRSPFCMVEFLEAARHLQEKETFQKPVTWPERLWVVPLPDVHDLLGWSKSSSPETGHTKLHQWKVTWLDQAADHIATVTKEFRGGDEASKKAQEKYVYHPWMKFVAESMTHLDEVVAALSQTRIVENVPPNGFTGPDLEAWTGNQARALAQKVVKKMTDIVTHLPILERQRRINDMCLRHWQSHKRDLAADDFEAFLEASPDYMAERRHALEEHGVWRYPELEPIRKYWRERQGGDGQNFRG